MLCHSFSVESGLKPSLFYSQHTDNAQFFRSCPYGTPTSSGLDASLVGVKANKRPQEAAGNSIEILT